MLDRVDVSHFGPLAGQIFQLKTPDGKELAMMVDGVKLKPYSCMPNAPATQRIPFSVSLTAQQSTAFVDGLCSMELGTLGLLENVFVSRVAPMDCDPSRAYYQIIFN